MVNINIEKRHLFLISAVFVFLGGVGLVVSGAVNPSLPWHGSSQVDIGGGRSLSDVMTLDTGKINCAEIEGIDIDFCNDDVGGGSLDCEIQTCSYLTAGKACTVSCSTGYTMTGVTGRVTWDTEGNPNFKGAYPPNLEEGNTWTCQFGENTGGATCYLRCCKII